MVVGYHHFWKHPNLPVFPTGIAPPSNPEARLRLLPENRSGQYRLIPDVEHGPHGPDAKEPLMEISINQPPVVLNSRPYKGKPMGNQWLLINKP